MIHIDTDLAAYLGKEFLLPALIIFLSAALTACGRPKPDDLSATSGLHGVLYPDSDTFHSSREARVNARIINDGHDSVPVNMWILDQPMTALEIINEENGERMQPVGIAAPDSPDTMQIKVLKPKETIEISYTLHIFSPELPRGRYRIQLRSIPSNKVHIIIQ